MTLIKKRSFVLGLASAAILAGCGNGIGSNGAARIDGRVDATLAYMYEQHPGTKQLALNSKGMLVMPLVTKGGLGLGGGYGRGALMINNRTVDYYAAAHASAGLQIGVAQYSHVLFFMTEDALREFRASSGWAAGANVEYALLDSSDDLRADTTTTFSPVVAVVFAQAGLRAGLTLEGIKYTRIIP